MSLKKQKFSADEIQIFDEAIIYLRGEYWQMRMWLQNEKKYARFSLRTRNRDTAFDKAKRYYHELMAQQLSGKSYFSKTTKQGVEEYLEQRKKDVDAGVIVIGRYGTIKTHLEHWLEFIGRDTKLKELDRIDCENYYHTRTKPNKKTNISQSTVLNEQSTINAMISWLFKRKEVYIEAFDFTKFKKIDKGDDALRRSIFTEEEIQDIATVLNERTKITKAEIADTSELSRVVIAYYFLISIITGLRKGEQLQLCWNDISWMEKNVQGQAGNLHSLVKIRVRAETTKVRKTRVFVVKDAEYFDALFSLLKPLYDKANKGKVGAKHFGNSLVFSIDGETQLTARALGFHFDKVLDLAKIPNRSNRDLVPYSFRHYFVTDMVNKGANPTQVAETCGTSTHQIEQTYYHTTEAKMITNALPQFEYKDGLLIPK
jgi:integrase